MYVIICTRFDIVFVVGFVSRFQLNPRMVQGKAIKRILWYLKGIANNSLCYYGNNLKLVGYTDTDWTTLMEESQHLDVYFY